MRMLYIDILLSACITVFSLGMLIVSLLSYKKYLNKKLLFVSLAFLLFLIKGMLLSLTLFYNLNLGIETLTLTTAMDLATLIVLFAATLTR